MDVMAAMSVARAMVGSAASVAEKQYFVSVAKGRGDQLRDLHDAIGMLERELLLDGRAFGKRTEYTLFHGKRF